MSLMKFATNVAGVTTRHETLDGKDYLVVPMVMLTEGVHTGCGAEHPLFYSSDELAKVPQIWNTKPVVVYHPSDEEGNPVSACTQDSLETCAIGMIMNAEFDGSRLTAEAWIDEVKSDAVDPRITQNIEAGDITEVSTGLFYDNEVVEGEFEGNTYGGVVRNIRPDHLAILPDETGACSVADGAGLLRNQAKDKPTGMVALMKKQQGFVANEVGAVDKRVMLRTALRDMEGRDDDDDDYYYHHSDMWIEEVFDATVVVEHNSKYYQFDYTCTDNGAVIDAESKKEVVRVCHYNDVGEGVDSPQLETNKQNEEHKMGKETLIAKLVGNTASQWTEEDREQLEGMSEETLTKMLPVEAEPVAVANAEAVPAVTSEQFTALQEKIDAMEAKDAAKDEAELQMVRNQAALAMGVESSALEGMTKEQLQLACNASGATTFMAHSSNAAEALGNEDALTLPTGGAI